MDRERVYRYFIKIFMISIQFLFFYNLCKIFGLSQKIAITNFLIYFMLRMAKNGYSFKTYLIWEELKRMISVHIEFLGIMLVFNIAYLKETGIFTTISMVGIFFIFNIFLAQFTRRVFINQLEKKLLIIGTGDTAEKLTDIIGQNKFTMYNLLGYVQFNDKVRIDKRNIACHFNDLCEYLQNNRVDEVIIALPKATKKEMMEITDKIEGKVRRIKYIPELNGVFTFNSEIEDYDGVMLVTTSQGIISLWQRIVKRGMDIVFGLAGFLVFGLLYLTFGMRIKKEDGGQILFAHNRIGSGLEPFPMYKFRSMYLNAEERLQEMLANDEELREEFYKNFKLKNDPRITKVGDFLRKTSLDEFPQFLNVLKGDMSMVGPRPVVQKEVDMYYGSKTGQKVFMVKPGITGMWQAHGRSDIEDYDERIALDMYYMRNWSIWLDMVIIIKTIKNVLQKKGAY